MDTQRDERERENKQTEKIYITKKRSWRQGDANDGEWMRALPEGAEKAAGM
jgi:hypothetical protein